MEPATADRTQPGSRRLAACALVLFACGDASGSGNGETLEGETACEKWTELAAAKGCSMPEQCSIDPACEPQAQAWIDCAARDLSQCLCESGDGSLNCEGSFKDNEGPALCFAEFSALQTCEHDDEPPAEVGAACLPEQVPENGFDGNEAYVESSSADCNGLACLVYRVEGDPRPGCVPTPEKPCAAPEQVQEHVHCSCRCQTPDGEDECVCPDGFSCVPTLEQGSPGVVGSYCVRNR